MIVKCTSCELEEHATAGYVCYGSKWFHPQCWKETEQHMEVIVTST